MSNICKCGHFAESHWNDGCKYRPECRCKKYSPSKPEPIPLGRWFPVVRKIKQTCCRCGHHMHLWLRIRSGNIEMKVTE